MKNKYNPGNLLAGQLFVLQVCDSCDEPGQSAPLNDGKGSEHDLDLYLVPEPHVCEHEPHDNHCAQFPSTGKKINYILY